VLLSIVLITYNEEINLARTLESVASLMRGGQSEIILVDSGSTDRTLEIAESFGAKIYLKKWKGFSAQKNSAIEKATGDWVLSLDADEELSPELASGIEQVLAQSANSAPDTHFPAAYWISRRNYFLGRWIRHGGFWPDAKLRLFRRGAAKFNETPVHETLALQAAASNSSVTNAGLPGYLLHRSYPTLFGYIEHMNRYSSLGADIAVAKGRHGFSLSNIVLRPMLTFLYNYFLRLGFLDGKEGLLLHLYHACYVSWKYAKAWEVSRDVRE
jgi:glycosyltransferase involved in cell wall biosynthesis